MSLERKRHFVEELKRHYRELIATARQAELGAAAPADALRSDRGGKDDARSASQFARMASGHRERRRRAKQEVDALIRFAASGLRSFPRSARVGLGALVDVRIEDDEEVEERTLFVLPVGAGTELLGPGGDGFVAVSTPDSPVGRALQGAGVGDSFELSVGGRHREWTVVDLC